MEMAGGRAENDVVIGNTFDKYGSQNFIVKTIMAGFARNLSSLVERSAPKTIHEVGCGEGYWTVTWARAGHAVRGTDFSTEVIGIAKENARRAGVPSDIFNARSIYDLTQADGADLIVCCEVLEHLEDPAKAVKTLSGLPHKHLIVSVPREPIWRILNLARLKYVGDLGNTPGHIQHWSRRGIMQLMARHYDIVDVRNPLPWTMMLCAPK